MSSKKVENGTDNVLVKTFKNIFGKEDEVLTAESAWLCTSYGVSSNLPIEKRIENKQKSIVSIIKSKFASVNGINSSHTNGSSYRCIVEIEDDLLSHVDKVLEPFITTGFCVINLSEKIEEVKDENLYMISWKNAFTTKC